MAEIATIFQLVQVGVETVPGTAVAATKKLASLMIEPQIKSEIQKYRGTGYKSRLSTATVPRMRRINRGPMSLRVPITMADTTASHRSLRS